MANNSPDFGEDRLLKLRDAAEYLGLAYGTVKNKVSRGELPVVRFGRGNVRIRKSQLDAWLVERTAAATAA
jgi:excisionase family DNA binding protein